MTKNMRVPSPLHRLPQPARLRKAAALAVTVCLLDVSAGAQTAAAIEPVRAVGPAYKRWYLPVSVPEARLGNSGRFSGLIRSGNLYLTVQDAIALALENNIDIEVARYNDITLGWRLERSQAGGALPGVPSGSSQASSNTSGQGVLGSQQAAGVSGGGSTQTRSSGNATVSQIGPVTQTLDPTFQESTSLSHRSLPQSNATQSVTQVIVQNKRDYTGSIQQGFLAGGSVTLNYGNHYLNENAPSDVLNPSLSMTAGFSITQNFLQGFGEKVGGRNIRIAKMNLDSSDLTLKTQVSRTVLAVLNSYYALVADHEDVKAKREALETAETFLRENRRRLELGAVAALDVTTADNQVAGAQQALVNSQLALEQQEVQLKNLISRTGLGAAELTSVRIVPLDRLEMPASDDLPATAELVKKAMQNRTDLLSEEMSLKTAEFSALGTRNGVLPQVQATLSRSTTGLAGTARTVRGISADKYFVGGVGSALGQVFRQNFPTESIGGGGRLVLGNRQAQADQGIDQLSLRQQELEHARSSNQVQVDVANAMVAIRQARARYEAAVQNRILQEKLLDAERKKFAAGESTTYNVTQQQRDLANARSTELTALINHRNARTYLDQTTGTVLESNGVTLADAKSGKLSRPSELPADLPK
jgi:outer membrane protein TolC